MLFIVLLGNPEIPFHSVPLGMLDWNMNCYHPTTMAQMISRLGELHLEIMKAINTCENVVLLETKGRKIC